MAEILPAKPVGRDTKTGRFLPGNRVNPNGRPRKVTLKEALRNRNESDVGKLAALAWRKALAGDLEWARFILAAFPKETEISGGLDHRVFDLGTTFTPEERARVYELALEHDARG